jgi:hypothetical protein
MFHICFKTQETTRHRMTNKPGIEIFAIIKSPQISLLKLPFVRTVANDVIEGVNSGIAGKDGNQSQTDYFK